MIIYLITWSGGYEPTQYAAFEERDHAIDQAVEWAAQIDRDDDQNFINILSLTRTHDTRRIFYEIEELELTLEEQNRFDELANKEEE